ncbi:MAG: AAA family ATPase [Flavobacteriia bacterium]|nr:AAA family ATPase [Flavobacteriia bacterium]
MLLLSGAIGIFQVEQDCFRYGVEWQVPSRINFRDFKQIVKAVIDGHLALGNPIPRHISVHAYHRNTYYVSLLNDFFEKFEFKSINSKEREKNYVLIIDEINRANLSSVLGELIYALEYRGKEVNSMYKIEDSEQLVLPPNLYIIGTMNTADRSVGHIDYAIRRRFAFVDILPKDLSDDTSIKFDSKLFADVAQLFDNYLSNEFEKKDVQLGHSYFIDKTEEGGTMAIRLEYEIKPILLEYVKDGILVGENIKDEILKLAASI